ncbi:hypothetical protein HBI24_095120 [Parastagonospora nodorum]|nr:hypothetical protein HBH95_214790 [Parastagonospora nodorum]KAH5226990.1 hypothetical protein HBI62_099630 [Parastagonospora nodorum]KAH5307408.1 hypothetical protein HBI12_161250 [Parastagonospora nodorum]KAH5584046.1 hypothetical protein HBI24_095120 [Parastagonospora nodorum]KAH5998580.1 hypothetical protein HBI83_225410 [Parastagonospora nodorum]
MKRMRGFVHACSRQTKSKPCGLCGRGISIFGVSGVRFVDDDVLDAFIVAGWESRSVAFDEQFGAEGCLGDVMYRTRLRCVPGFGFQRGEEDPDAFGELVEMHIVRTVLEAFIPHVFVRAIIWSLCCG